MVRYAKQNEGCVLGRSLGMRDGSQPLWMMA